MQNVWEYVVDLSLGFTLKGPPLDSAGNEVKTTQELHYDNFEKQIQAVAPAVVPPSTVRGRGRCRGS
jgi:hypothetical protein